MTRAERRRLALAAITLAILVATTWPWSTFVGHSHWDLVEWVPLTGGFHPVDMVANTLLFAPFGAAYAWSRRRRPVGHAVLAGLLLSVAIELYQVYCHGHFPSMTDVCTDTLGTWLGARASWRFSPRPARPVLDAPFPALPVTAAPPSAATASRSLPLPQPPADLS